MNNFQFSLKFIVKLKLIFELCMIMTFVSRRKRIGTLATKKWGDNLPKFNSPESKAELEAFAKEITPECSIPEINFNEEGIARHIQTFYSEQRRYRKNKKPSSPQVCVSHKLLLTGIFS